jgi:hypothetical protein
MYGKRFFMALSVGTACAYCTVPIARAQPTTAPQGTYPATSASVSEPDASGAQVPYETPRETLIPGTPGMPGGLHLMINGFAEAQNAGVSGYRIANQGVAKTYNAGATYPLLVGDWAMVYGRDARGWFEGMLMLDFEPFTVGAAGIPEIGQSGEGLWDAQHAHQFIHQAMVAFHPLAGVSGWHPEGMMTEGRYDLALFGGQGSATIGPPIFMHRASSPGPTVPRKHHKGENPHETFPVIGASLRLDRTWLEGSVFSGLELTPEDSRFYPHVAPPDSAAARIRHVFGGWVEVQTSGERLRNQGNGEPDAWQASASAYAWGQARGWRLDGLLDWAIDVPDPGPTGNRPTSQGALGEFAARTPSRRQTMWIRSEFNQREESPELGGFVSSPWLFETLGFEEVVLGGTAHGVQLGLFGEGTFISIPESLHGVYGTDVAVTLNVGVHLFGMWMLDGEFRPMMHGATDPRYKAHEG